MADHEVKVVLLDLVTKRGSGDSYLSIVVGQADDPARALVELRKNAHDLAVQITRERIPANARATPASIIDKPWWWEMDWHITSTRITAAPAGSSPKWVAYGTLGTFSAAPRQTYTE